MRYGSIESAGGIVGCAGLVCSRIGRVTAPAPTASSLVLIPRLLLPVVVVVVVGALRLRVFGGGAAVEFVVMEVPALCFVLIVATPLLKATPPINPSAVARGHACSHRQGRGCGGCDCRG
jgi:hypothetical protein